MGTTTVDLPGGYQATLRDPQQLKERHRRLIQSALVPLTSVYARVPAVVIEAAAEADPATEAGKEAVRVAEASLSAVIQNRQEAQAFAELRDCVIVALLQSWTVPQPLPTVDNVQDLDPDLYNALDAATSALGGKTMDAAHTTNFNVTPDTDEASGTPFDASANSNASSKATESGASTTRKPRSAGASTATEASSAV